MKTTKIHLIYIRLFVHIYQLFQCGVYIYKIIHNKYLQYGFFSSVLPFFYLQPYTFRSIYIRFFFFKMYFFILIFFPSNRIGFVYFLSFV